MFGDAGTWLRGLLGSGTGVAPSPAARASQAGLPIPLGPAAGPKPWLTSDRLNAANADLQRYLRAQQAQQQPGPEYFGPTRIR